MRTRVFGIVVLAFLALVNSAAAQETPAKTGDSIRVVQQKPFIKALRLEIEPTFNLPLNETITQHVGAGVQVRFHIKDWVAIGADYVKYFGWSTDFAESLGDAYSVYPEKRLMDFYVGGHLSFVPMTGKFLWLGSYGKPVYWDLFIVAGGGAAKTLFGNYHGSGNIGVGWRLAVASWLTINFEVRDYMYMENYAVEDKFVNNFVFTLGLGVFIPFSHKYVNPK